MLTHVRYEYEMIPVESFFKFIFKAGLGKIKHALHDVEILDWQTHCWVVEMNSGQIKAITKVDATFVEVRVEEMKKALDRTKANMESLERAVTSVTSPRANPNI